MLTDKINELLKEVQDLHAANAEELEALRRKELWQKGRIKKYYTKEMLADLMRYGHEQGLKMCVSMRMGAWGMEFPYDQIYFECRFTNSHPELR